MGKDTWPRVAVLGAGAVGSYFGGMLARAGAPVTLIGRPQYVDAINRDGLTFDGLQFQDRLRVTASSEVSAVSDAGLVLFCVKTPDTETAAHSLAPWLAPDAVVLSLQNGVDNVERLRAAGIDAIATVVYVAAAMTAPGRLKHNGRGDLVIGDLPRRPAGAADRQQQIDSLAALFPRAGVPCRVSDNVEGELWTKMIINCAYNAISAVGQARYRQLGSSPYARAVMIDLLKEAIAVAEASGVRLPVNNLVEEGMKITETMAGATSSMAQDLARGKRTEIDSLNGYVVRRGAALGISTPVNQTLYAVVKLLEESL